jgi:hypothetical protein
MICRLVYESYSVKTFVIFVLWSFTWKVTTYMNTTQYGVKKDLMAHPFLHNSKIYCKSKKMKLEQWVEKRYENLLDWIVS